MKELDKLEEYLKEKGIKYERYDEMPLSKNYIIDYHQICVPCWNPETRDWDAICHRGSFGYEEGLLEIMGSITRNDDVEGWLTAEDVIERIEEHDKEGTIRKDRST